MSAETSVFFADPPGDDLRRSHEAGERKGPPLRRMEGAMLRCSVMRYPDQQT